MHEIITLQLGQQSNYLATHFWNAQESYFTYGEDQALSPIDHDIHFRPGLAPDGTETYMPRTVIYDLKSSYGTLRKINALYEIVEEEDSQPQALWQGQATIHKAPAIPESPYQAALNSGLTPSRPSPSQIRFFSDYSRIFYHPRSIIQLIAPELELHLNANIASSSSAASAGPSTSSIPPPLERYAAGEELFNDLDKEHDLLDRDLRPFVEEADHMQGVQVIAGMDDAWGGFASQYVERIRDEYGKVGIWVWGVENGPAWGVSRERRLLRLANKARSLIEVYKQASIIVPLAVPERLPLRLQLDYSSQWHTSALLMAAMESATLPSRLRDPLKRDTLSDMAELLNTMGKQSVAGLQMSFSAVESGQRDHRDPLSQRRKLTEEELSEGVQLDVKFTPSDQLEPYGRRNGYLALNPRVFSQLISLRGYSEADNDEQLPMVDERGRIIRQSAYEPITKTYATPLHFPVLDSYPEIFRNDVGTPVGDVVNITTNLATDSSVFGRLKRLRQTVLRSFSIEDRETLGNELMEMADEYHEGWSSGTDDGEDD